MLSINTNLSSLIAQNSLTTSTNKLNQAIERMTTGFKINHAKDNAANYSIATNMTTKINSYMVAEDNCAMGLDMLSTANGSLDQISDKLTRIRDLATQASNGTYGQPSLIAINSEANALVDEINRLYSTAEYNGMKLFGEDTAAAAPIAMFAMNCSATTESYFITNPISYTDEQVEAMTTMTELVNGTTSATNKYSISTIDELMALANYVNTENDTTGMIFVLGADIDLSSISNWTPIGDYKTNSNYQFKGTFDGNGHVIRNLTIDNESKNYQGLFGRTASGSEIKNVGIEGGSVKANGTSGGLVGQSASSISNSYATVNVTGSLSSIGGLVGISTSSINNCYATGDISGVDNVGGLVGYYYPSSSSSISNCYATGSVTGNSNVGGLVGLSNSDSISNSYATGNVTGSSSSIGGLVGKSISSISNSYATGSVTGPTGSESVTNSSDWNGTEFTYPIASVPGNTTNTGGDTPTPDPDPDPEPTPDPEPDPAPGGGGGGTGGGTTDPVDPVDPVIPTPPTYASDTVFLQIGISSNWASQICVGIKFTLDNIDELRMIGLDTTTDYLSKIDTMLEVVSAKQTEYGAAQNRLESALESIEVNINNLTSSLSTIYDADIAEVSSDYIRQQILQQASATLMSTSNQSPSIALQLI